jgi:hypothetical protein
LDRRGTTITIPRNNVLALIRLIGGAALLLQLGGALAADPIKIAYINSMSGTFAFQEEQPRSSMRPPT